MTTKKQRRRNKKRNINKHDALRTIYIIENSYLKIPSNPFPKPRHRAEDRVMLQYWKLSDMPLFCNLLYHMPTPNIIEFYEQLLNH